MDAFRGMNLPTGDSMLLQVNHAVWLDAARKHAREAATAAASWTTDGNGDPATYRETLRMLAEGHPEASDRLPAPPNLSGEYADGPTPVELVVELTGGLQPYSGDPALPDWVADDLCNAWEEEVSEVFETYCELELMRALGIEEVATEAS